jgi:hypothetical protein
MTPKNDPANGQKIAPKKSPKRPRIFSKIAGVHAPKFSTRFTQATRPEKKNCEILALFQNTPPK